MGGQGWSVVLDEDERGASLNRRHSEAKSLHLLDYWRTQMWGNMERWQCLLRGGLWI